MSSLDEIIGRYSETAAEEKLRATNPGLQELWDQYQTMLKLVTTKKKTSKAEDILTMLRRNNQNSNIAMQELEKEQRALDARRKELLGE